MTTAVTTLSWNPQQAAALDAVAKWLRDPLAPQVFRLFGYAGTGKTTLAMHLAAQESGLVIFAAYTGKAASVMRQKGCTGAMTLHSLLYTPGNKDRTKLTDLRARLDRDPGNPELQWEYDQELARVRQPAFSLNPDSMLQFASLLVVDEVSMVDARIGKDAESFKKKILVLGDPAQLPPVKGGGYFTDQRPDILLTEIHRQAADNPILRWATLARRGEVIPYGDLGAAKKFRREKINMSWLARSAGQILTGKNATRHALNAGVRKSLGRVSAFPEAGDSLVMLMNDHELGVLNGVICSSIREAILDPAEPEAFVLDVRYEEREILGQVFDAGPFRGKDTDPWRKYLQIDYGYALTVHKSQGSQWPTVTLYDDGFAKQNPTDRQRWLYTAITRAEHTLYIVTS